jgi:hypothetical protein
MVRLCFAVFVLMAALGLVAVGEQSAEAAPCCSSCDAIFFGCLSGYPYPQCGGDVWCCDQSTDWCYRHCSFSC